MRRAAILLALFFSCTSAAREAPTLPTGAVRFETPRGPWIVKVEVARDDASRERGLMFRRELRQKREDGAG